MPEMTGKGFHWPLAAAIVTAICVGGARQSPAADSIVVAPEGYMGLAEKVASAIESAIGEVSIIVAADRPKALGLKCDCGREICSCAHSGRYEGYNIAGVRIGNWSYCVVGEVPRNVLADVPARLRSKGQ